jgi:hypothetical protein
MAKAVSITPNAVKIMTMALSNVIVINGTLP